MSRVYRQRDAVVAREIANEVILVPVRGRLAQLQHIFVLNPVAAFIWERLDGRRDLATIHRQLVEDFEVEAEDAKADLCEYVEGLRDAELIQEREASVEAAAAAT
ncbi:MAG: PqqD family protein [Acidobacteriota bacterium]